MLKLVSVRFSSGGMFSTIHISASNFPANVSTDNSFAKRANEAEKLYCINELNDKTCSI